MSIKPWRILDSSYVARTPWLNLRADRCETAEGIGVDAYYVLECRDWAHVIALDSDDRLLVTRQYRHGNQRIGLEIPCGEIDPSDATPLHAGQRELLEETGYTASEWRDIGTLDPNPARQGNLMHCFLARGLKRSQAPATDAYENIECEFLALSEVCRRMASGEFAHALHVAAVYRALHVTGRLRI